MSKREREEEGKKKDRSRNSVHIYKKLKQSKRP